MPSERLSEQQIALFQRDGFLVLANVAKPNKLMQLLKEAERQLIMPASPLEYEASLGYDGAPVSIDANGGHTVRRLLDAYGRHIDFRRWATSPLIVNAIRQLLGKNICLVKAHHNCIMTKHPRYSSATGWHRDIRYWSFTSSELISAWLALGPETQANGALNVLPGSHLWDISESAFDAQKILHTDKLSEEGFEFRPQAVELAAGDLLLFHARTLHCAGKNLTAQTKYALVFTYREALNKAISGTRSDSMPDLLLT